MPRFVVLRILRNSFFHCKHENFGFLSSNLSSSEAEIYAPRFTLLLETHGVKGLI